MSDTPQALIFDFDGLILDTETPDVTAWQLVFREHGVKFPDSWWIHAIGRGVDLIDESPEDLLIRLLGRPLDKDALTAYYMDIKMGWIYAEPIRPGVERMLREAQDAGLRLAVASSSHHRWVDGHLTRLGLIHHFEQILCADDVPRPKPFPDLYVAACKALELPASVCIAIEDSPNGTRSAKEAGLKVIACPNSITARLDLSEADVLVETLDHPLAELLGRL